MGTRGRPRTFDRNEALRRAMELFWEHGYEGTSMTELTAAMKINSPSLYAAFGDKESLFREAIDLYESIHSVADPALSDSATARDAIERLLRAGADSYSNDDGPLGCMIVLAGSTYTTRNVAIRDLLVDRRQLLVGQLVERLRRGIADGDLTDGLDLESIAEFYVTVLYGLSLRARDGVARPALDTIVDAAMTAWPGLTTPAASGR